MMLLSQRSVVWIRSEIKTPPISEPAREEMGRLIRRLQRGLVVTMPHSRPMPEIGRQCHEFRVTDADMSWRVIYRIDADAIIVVSVFSKKTTTTPTSVMQTCRKRLAEYDQALKGRKDDG